MEEPLFSHFLVIRLAKTSESGRNNLEPKIRLCLPAPGHSIDTVPLAVPRLAFPDLDSFRLSTRMVSEAFKENLGSSCFMFFRRHLHNQSKKQDASNSEAKNLECLCLITKFDLHEIFEFVMQQIQIRWLLSPHSVPPFLLFLLKQVTKIPPPSGHIALALRPNADEQGSNENFLLHRPSFDHMGAPSDVLFDYLSIDNVMTLMSALLCEQRVIITSSSITTISQCIYAARSLLYPFKWHYMFASILPGSMLYHMFATTPFLVGIVKRDMHVVSKLPLNPTLIVDLDHNALESIGEVECITLPGMANKLRSKLGHVAPQGVLSDRLKKGLNNILGKSLDMDQIMSSNAIYALWMTFYIFTFGGWRKYIDVNVSGVHSFNTTKFLDAARNSSEDEFIFFERFCHTRMFCVFIQELLKHSQSSLSGDANDFCRLCSIVARRDPLDQNLGFYNVMDALKTEMYPSRTGRIASAAMEFTSSGPSTFDRNSALSILAQATFSSLGLKEIFSVVKYRLGDCEGRSWRHASLTFEMLHALLYNGSDAVLTVLRDNASQFLQFPQYTHKEEETQALVRNQAEKLLRTIFDLSEQANRRSRNYCCIPDSVLSFKVRTPSVEPQSTCDPASRNGKQIPIGSSPFSNQLKFTKEFHSSARKALIENVNDSWLRYREKSIIKGRSRIFPKFAKLHKKLGVSEPGTTTIGLSQFEDLLDLQSISNTVDFTSLSSTLPTVQASVIPSTDLSWLSTATAPSSQSSSNNDFMLEFLGSSTVLKDGSDVQQNNSSAKVTPFDPFEGLFK